MTNEDQSIMTSDQSMIERSRKFGMSQEVVIQEAMKEGTKSQTPFLYLNCSRKKIHKIFVMEGLF